MSQSEAVAEVKAKNPHAVAMGALGGKARLVKMTAEQRRAVATMGAIARAQKLTPERRREIGRMGGLARMRMAADTHDTIAD